jgi:NADH-quinone oxidoreductase subunit J
MTPNQIVFLVLAAIALLGAMGVVAFGEKPVWSALCLVLNFIVLAFVYFSLGNQFLGITQIMVYAGAIMVLFLFVIMILKLSTEEGAKQKKGLANGILPIVAGLGIFALIFVAVVFPMMTVTSTPLSQEFLRVFGTPQAVGRVMFSQYVYPFEIASILLLIGVVGSILLAKRRLQ